MSSPRLQAKGSQATADQAQVPDSSISQPPIRGSGPSTLKSWVPSYGREGRGVQSWSQKWVGKEDFEL